MCVKQSKVCSKCKADKPSSEYSTRIKKTTRKSGEVYEVMCLMSACKECRRLASLSGNMKKEHLERKRERDRIRAKIGENRDKRNEATKKYRQSEKGKEYYGERSKGQKENKLMQMYGAKCDIISVICSTCGKNQIKKDNSSKHKLYRTACTECIKSRTGIKIPSKEVGCIKCGLMHVAKHPQSHCDSCKVEAAIKQRKQHRQARKGKPRTDQHRKRARLYGSKYEPINKIKVFERDKYKCYLCRIDVVVSKTYRPDQATIDHVIAMANGGDHTHSNVRTCCHACNSRKGDTWIDDPSPLCLSVDASTS